MLCPSCMPPQYSSISCWIVMPAGASLTPGSFTRPETENERKPLRPFLPCEVNQAPPFSRISRTQYKVSKLCSSVGRPNKPNNTTNNKQKHNKPHKPTNKTNNTKTSPQI